MLSFRFDLSAAQVRMLLEVYAGYWLPGTRYRHDEITSRVFGMGAAVRVRIEEKGLTKRLTVKVGDHKGVGWEVTPRGRTICETIVEDAERIVELAGLARRRRTA